MNKKKITIKGIMQNTKMLEEMVMEAVKKKAELEEKVKALEEEKTNLLAEIEALKAIPELEAKVSALEAEVARLREEKKALEEKVAPTPFEAPCETAPPETVAPAEEKPYE
jgi:peptidoglycan hydrolase CwlO-like protein